MIDHHFKWFIKYGTFALLLSTIIYVCSFVFGTRYAQDQTEKWLEPLGVQHKESYLRPLLTSTRPGRNPKELLLRHQLETVGNRAVFHRNVMAYFYQRQHAALVTTSVCGGIAALALFVITTVGWQGSNPYLRGLFLVMAVHTALFAALPALYRQQENINDNRERYIRYIDLKYEILAHIATKRTAQGKVRQHSDMILYVNRRMAELNNVSIGFDSSKVPTYQDAFGKPAVAGK